MASRVSSNSSWVMVESPTSFASNSDGYVSPKDDDFIPVIHYERERLASTYSSMEEMDVEEDYDIPGVKELSYKKYERRRAYNGRTTLYDRSACKVKNYYKKTRAGLPLVKGFPDSCQGFLEQNKAEDYSFPSSSDEDDGFTLVSRYERKRPASAYSAVEEVGIEEEHGSLDAKELSLNKYERRYTHRNAAKDYFRRKFFA
ncbi:MAG: hypothetical protein FJZ63_00260 [Chlamydiae bacterium]|nr:hypothetical protein [Chlamydiota bacterium]